MHAFLDLDPDRRAIDVPFVIRRKGFFPDADALQKKLAKKYRVERVQIRMRNPHFGDVPVTVVIVIHLLDKYVGPALKKLVKHASELLMEQMDAKFKAKRRKAKRKGN